ncbi:choice-of-anchor D domain-containing protein [bacterium]|nr:choice-of-anchor D domain-containing protein [bacterium]
MSSLAVATPDSLPPGFEKDVVNVKFTADAEWKGTPKKWLPDYIMDSVQVIKPLFSVPKVTLDKMRGRGQQRLQEFKDAGVPLPFEEAPDLSLWYKIILKRGVDQLEFVQSLETVPGVDTVSLNPLPSPPPSPPPFIGPTPDFTGQQGYLDPAPDGIDADYSWLVPGGTGLNVKIIDVEYDWNQDHEDLDKALGVPLLMPPGFVNDPPFPNDHGTAVLGELIATVDAIGVTGISFDADIGLAPTKTIPGGFSIPNAILLATADSTPGDVILMETQTGVCGLTPSCDDTQINCGPSEWDPVVFAAVQNAVALGITVVSAAGNGSVDLDRPECLNWFNRNVQDSGAIIVGAGHPTTLDKLGFSSYGSRVDVQGWGGSVMTTGYGTDCGHPTNFNYCDENDPTNANRWYRPTFGGTSSASPIVTGAVANLQGIAMANGSGQPLLPSEVRDILASTGTPQPPGSPSEHIGPRPNLRRAIAEIVPIMQIPTSTLAFGDTCVGDSHAITLEVCNASKQDLVITSIDSSDPQFGVNAPTAGFPVIISPDHCFPFEVAFTPSGGGVKSANLTVNSNDVIDPSVEVVVTGTGTQADIALAIANSGNFGEVCTGAFADLNLSLLNQGGCNLTINSISSDDLRFVLPDDTTFPLILSPDADFNFPVRFEPDVCGPNPITGTITINSDDPDEGLLSVDVSGVSPCPDINVAIANSGDFGNVCNGDTKDLDLTLFNQGKCDLEISSVTMVGTDPDWFDLPTDLQIPLVLSPDADFRFPVRFSPDECSDTTRAAQVQITSDDPDEGTVNVGVSGTAPCPNLVIDPADLESLYAFPTTVVDTTGTLGCFSERSATLRNNSVCPLTISNITTQSGVDYAVVDPTQYPILLPSGEETLEVTVRLTPQSDAHPLMPSEISDVLVVESDDPDSTHEANLCGESAQQSGVRVLVTDVSSGDPVVVEEVDRIAIQSKGTSRPGPINLEFTDHPVSSETVCGKEIYYHVNQETLPATDTTGSDPRSSYLAKAQETNLKASEQFGLGQCEFRDFQLQLTDSKSEICLLKAKGDSCSNDGECCSYKCKGPIGRKTCK